MERLTDRKTKLAKGGIEPSMLDVVHKLAEYEDLEEQGKLLKLPCAVGDTVYELQEIRHRIQPFEIISINIGRMGETYFNWKLKDGIGIYQNVKGFGTNQLGKTVFLTECEAETALQKMEEVDAE